MSKTYEIEIQKDTETGDAFFELPNELMKKLDWNPGDDLKWDETPTFWLKMQTRECSC